VLRTADSAFKNLPGFPFSPNYLQDLEGFPGLRIHYVDEGNSKDPKQHVFLCLHGEPSWSYIYRKMIPIFTAVGHRVVAPDFIGFGRSDKLVEDKLYTFNFHREVLIKFIEKLDLKNITLVCQDWGGLLGLTLPMDMPNRFSRLLIMNTFLGTGDADPGEGFLAWKDYVNKNPDFDVARLMARSSTLLSPAECAAYGAPFPSKEYKAGVRRFPSLVPISPDMEGADLSRRARDWWSKEWNGKTFMAIGSRDPVLGTPAMLVLKAWIKGCGDPLFIEEGGHFLQEWGERVAVQALISFGDLRKPSL